MNKLEVELMKAVRENTAQTKVTNALLLAQSMSLDIGDPVQAQKVLRRLASVAKYVEADTNV